MEIGINYKQETQKSLFTSFYEGYYHFYYIHEGECEAFLGDNIYELGSGCVIFVNSNSAVKFLKKSDELKFTIIYMQTNYLKEYLEKLQQKHLLNLFLDQNNGAARIIFDESNKTYSDLSFRLIEKEFVCYENPDNYSVLLMTINLLIHFSKCSYAVIKDKDELPYNQKVIIEEATNYLKNHYDSAFVLGDLAEHLQLSTSYTSKFFKKNMGMSVRDYIMGFRISKAKLLLLNERISILDISEQCGFETLQHFSRVFKEYTGQTASDFRKSVKNSLT